MVEKFEADSFKTPLSQISSLCNQILSGQHKSSLTGQRHCWPRTEVHLLCGTSIISHMTFMDQMIGLTTVFLSKQTQIKSAVSKVTHI